MLDDITIETDSAQRCALDVVVEHGGAVAEFIAGVSDAAASGWHWAFPGARMCQLRR
jgi:hypothetical protein